jgi:hypothetical protein
MFEINQINFVTNIKEGKHKKIENAFEMKQ